MTILITGVAGFIGSRVAQALMARGEEVVGIDNFSPFYDPVLKFARLKPLKDGKNFTFLETDIADRETMLRLVDKHRGIDRIVHLAAQPSVKHANVDPFIYAHTNVMGHLVVLELAHQLAALRHMIYASSSSVYGANRKLPFAVEDRVDRPVSLYAATKRSGELMSETYAHLHGMRITGLRYFTVYGPWGRPDMSPHIFAKAIHEGTTIPLYHLGFVKRDFSYIDDIVAGTLLALDKPAEQPGHRLYNLGAAHSEDIVKVVGLFEKAIGRKAIVELRPGEPGDMQETAADITETTREFGWTPKVPVEDGVPKFVGWFRSYYGL
ncbi:MAG: NAD-dependent epimerase/dehydratase family protein [Enhydrobacter sp.]|nr:MAG: NAD-dependent epimerase/dehydratase family protein [Enhydrobacter sp.]